jgi:hypothetical protein
MPATKVFAIDNITPIEVRVRRACKSVTIGENRQLGTQIYTYAAPTSTDDFVQKPAGSKITFECSHGLFAKDTLICVLLTLAGVINIAQEEDVIGS